MKEDFLHYIWQYKKIDCLNLKTQNNEVVQILHTGQYNKYSGPDFMQAQLKIGDVTWVGNIEIHVHSSDWLKHGHQEDKAYNNVILHVVYEHDTTVFRENGEAIPCLQLKNKIEPNLIERYKRLIYNQQFIPCQDLHELVGDMTKKMWLNRVALERLERKSQNFETLFKANKNNWEETFFQTIARAYGHKNNADSMEEIARRLPLTLIAKHKNSLFQLEALFLGQGGFLEKNNTKEEDEYVVKLRTEYLFLKNKYDLKPLYLDAWQYLRIRPNSYPEFRLAQLAALVHQSVHLLSKIIEIGADVKQLKTLLKTQASAYWQTNFRVGTTSKSVHTASMGTDSIENILINTIAPFFYFYAKTNSSMLSYDAAINVLEQLPTEKNSLIQEWQTIGFSPKNALESQALLELKNNYCNHKKCLNCSIGTNIVNTA